MSTISSKVLARFVYDFSAEQVGKGKTTAESGRRDTEDNSAAGTYLCRSVPGIV